MRKITDAERMDWLQEKKLPVEIFCRAKSKKEIAFTFRINCGEEFESIREAIDEEIRSFNRRGKIMKPGDTNKYRLDKIIYGYLIDMQKNGISATVTTDRILKLMREEAEALRSSETVDGHKRKREK